MSSHSTGRPLWAEINLAALAHNIRALKSLAAPAQLAAVVKANAYGHGSVPVAQAALEAGANRLAVICVEEGAQLREAGIGAAILVLGPSLPGDAHRIVSLRLTPVVNSVEMARALASEAAAAGIRQPIHLKVDTGLNRFGLKPAEVLALASEARSLPSLMVEGIFTHFADADAEDKTRAREQFRQFLSVTRQLDWIPVRHVANTASLLTLPEFNLEMVRPGGGIYGCCPPGVHMADLQPILSLNSRIVRLQRIEAGESVSYSRTWTAAQPSTIALVTCGYGDGLPRALSNRGQMLVRGQRAPIAGRVCMDMTMLDVTGVPDAAEGDAVTIIGKQGQEEITVEEIAGLCGTINYEILCGISGRVKRLYTGETGETGAVAAPATGLPAKQGAELETAR